MYDVHVAAVLQLILSTCIIHTQIANIYRKDKSMLTKKLFKKQRSLNVIFVTLLTIFGPVRAVLLNHKC